MTPSDTALPADRALIGLGSNLNDPLAQCREALQTLNAHPEIEVLSASRAWESPAWGMESANRFVNGVALVRCALTPEALLDVLLDTERGFGRVRRADGRWSDRTLDLDLLDHGNRQVETARLRLPHPGIAARRFVLAPLLEVAPSWYHPVSGRTAHELLADLDDPLPVTPMEVELWPAQSGP